MSETIDTVQFPCTGSPPPKSHLDPMVQALPIRSLNRLSLQQHLDDIGKTRA